MCVLDNPHHVSNSLNFRYHYVVFSAPNCGPHPLPCLVIIAIKTPLTRAYKDNRKFPYLV